ncbi:MAG: ATP-binding cassette domain-containing protein, partial [Micromonosporaceae bacterium]
VLACTGAAAVAGVGFAAGAVAAGALAPVLVAVLALVPLALTDVLLGVPAAATGYDALRTAHRRVQATLTEAALNGATPAEATPTEATPAGDTPAEATLTEAAQTEVTPAGAALPSPGASGGAVRLRGVDVRWPGAAAPALRDVHLEIPAGTHVAVTGPSGAGKSTLLALLLGFLEPERGSAERPARVAWCPQESQLVSTTIRENLRLADPSAGDQRLATALTDAGLGGWRDRLDTRLDGYGANASGGEAQRLALARTLVAVPDAELVLLDEPTAHLDRTTADTVLSGLERALAGRTVVHVTHRPDEAARADLILDVRDGQVRLRTPTSPEPVLAG